MKDPVCIVIQQQEFVKDVQSLFQSMNFCDSKIAAFLSHADFVR